MRFTPTFFLLRDVDTWQLIINTVAQDLVELRAAVGLESHESTSGNRITSAGR